MISAGDEEMFSEQIRAQLEFYHVTVLERLLFLPAIDSDQYSEYSVIECAKKMPVLIMLLSHVKNSN